MLCRKKLWGENFIFSLRVIKKEVTTGANVMLTDAICSTSGSNLLNLG
jgi:hypothetical protein